MKFFRFAALFASLLMSGVTSNAVAQNRTVLPENCRCGATARRAVCPQDVPSDVIYRPAAALCGGKAMVILRGPFFNSFSVVVRDNQNRDRWPVSGYGGCSFNLANSKSPPKRCSAFKASSDRRLTLNGIPSRVFCFPEKGTSRLWNDVRRITIKLENSAASIRRLCIGKATLPLN